jgi:hypothetical protein
MISGKYKSRQELIALLRQEIKAIVEQVCDPETPDEQRYKLDAICKEKIAALYQLGGKWDESLDKDGVWSNKKL